MVAPQEKKTPLLRRLTYLVLVAVLSVGAYTASDVLARRAWTDQGTWIVRLLKTELLPKESSAQDDPNWESQSILASVLYRSGDRQGARETVKIERLVNSALELKPGCDYVMVIDTLPDGSTVASLADRFRLPAVVAFLTAVAGLLVVSAGRAGARALIGLALSMWYLASVFLPSAAAGSSPLAGALGAVAVVSILTIGVVVRRKRYWPVALGGALGGAVAAWFLGFAALKLWQITGLGSDGALVLSSTVEGINMGHVFLASVIIGAAVAVHDVAISVSAAMAELEDYDPDIAPKRLWQSGLNVGREILGTMVNTLVLAYFGSSLCLLILMAQAQPDIHQLLNDGQVAQEIAQSLAGTVGLLLTVPITAAAGALAAWWRKKR